MLSGEILLVRPSKISMSASNKSSDTVDLSLVLISFILLKVPSQLTCTKDNLSKNT